MNQLPETVFTTKVDELLNWGRASSQWYMAATNRPEILDAALLRPGRFDRQILVDRPDIKGRTKILQLHAKKVKLSADLDLALVAAKTPGFVGADLANIVNEAALLAARQDKASIEMAEFDEAIERVVAGLQKKSHVINPKEKKTVAYHESGHALLAELVPGADPVSKISIIPRGIAALGYTTQLPTEDHYLLTRSELVARIDVLLGGRVAEEIVFGEISTGAQNDLQRATEIARTMVTQFGMSEKLGLATLEGPRRASFLMNVICSDKTGTLTEGIVHLQSAVDVDGAPSDKVFLHAYLNAFYETGFTNPIDEAIRASRKADLTGYQKTDEIPYDFLRKRLSILVAHENTHLMVTKGALANVLAVCASAEVGEGKIVDLATVQDHIQQHLEEFSHKGCRTLGVAYKNMGSASRMSKVDEAGMTFLGFLVLFDPPKAKIIETIGSLKTLGVALKIITGDNHLVAANVSQQMGLSNTKILSGADLRDLSDGALLRRVADVDVFAEIEPNQKERIILALKKAGNVVGYMGDGINDASALHAADVGISVESAVDVAKEAADIVLLEKDLGVLVQGVREGRTTFANTLKYVFMISRDLPLFSLGLLLRFRDHCWRLFFFGDDSFFRIHGHWNCQAITGRTISRSAPPDRHCRPE